jgi:hypothetical protein
MESWLPVPKKIIYQLLEENGSAKYTESLAFLSLQLDLDARSDVSELGYSKMWGWSRKKVKNFIKNSGLVIIRTSNCKKSLGKLQKEQQRNNKGTIKEHMKVNVFGNLQDEKNNKGTLKEQQGSTTKHTETETYMLAELLQNLDSSSQEYVRNELRRKNPANPLAYAKAVIRRLDNERTERSASYENYSGNGNAGCGQELPAAHRAALEYLSSL